MLITTTINHIGWSKYANAKIDIIREYSPSNDFEGCYIYIDDKPAGASDSVTDALDHAFGPELAEWIHRYL